jgi:sugar O-acyltransferase (sialic acid O-acetyltransferase NeuD family)
MNCIIIGAGGHAAELMDYIQAVNTEGNGSVNVMGLLDDNPANYAHYEFYAPYLGSIKEHVIDQSVTYLIGIANIQYRKTIVQDFLDKGARFISIIHPRAFISKTARVGEGTVIAPYVNVGPKAVIGAFNLLNSRSSIAHDSVLGAFNFISPNVAISGFTNIGKNNLFGVNSATIPGIKIGDNNKISAGMVVDKQVGDNEIVFHRFKEKIIAVPSK